MILDVVKVWDYSITIPRNVGVSNFSSVDRNPTDNNVHESLYLFPSILVHLNSPHSLVSNKSSDRGYTCHKITHTSTQLPMPLSYMHGLSHLHHASPYTFSFCFDAYRQYKSAYWSSNGSALDCPHIVLTMLFTPRLLFWGIYYPLNF